jgi:hypothetical protein
MMPLPLAEVEQLIGLPKSLLSQERAHRFTLEKLEAVMDQSLGTIQDVVWALGPTGPSSPACGAWRTGAGGRR